MFYIWLKIDAAKKFKNYSEYDVSVHSEIHRIGVLFSLHHCETVKVETSVPIRFLSFSSYLYQFLNSCNDDII